MKGLTMRRSISSAILLLCLATTFISAQASSPASANDLLQQSLVSAGSSGKTVWVIFHASWCSWCKRLDAALTNADVKPIVEKHFVLLHLDVMERGEKKAALENPGGVELMKQFGGEKSGLPFYAFVNANGTKIGDSNVMPKESNIGYPGSPEEIDAFVKIVRAAAPKLSDAEAETIVTYLKTHAPK
jgi:thiol:disulfide interchange protein